MNRHSMEQPKRLSKLGDRSCRVRCLEMLRYRKHRRGGTVICREESGVLDDGRVGGRS